MRVEPLPVLRRVPAAWRYAAAGVLLGLGAPAGLLFLRIAVASVDPIGEMRNNYFYYAYALLGTCAAFGAFGFLTGRRADQLRRSRDLYQTLSNRDAVTRLLNGRAIRGRYRRALQHAAQFREPVSVLFIDLDALKKINDRFSHSAGSAALRQVARILEESKREEDLAGRWGGDEFLVVMPGADSPAACRVAQRVLEAVRRRPVQHGEQPIPITVTIGVGTLVGPAPTDALFEVADRALNQGKRAGGDQLRLARIAPSAEGLTAHATANLVS